MGMHPNAILLLVLTPDDLARKTYRGILQKHNTGSVYEEEVKISGENYHIKIMEESYLEGFQIASSEGDIIVLDMFTYGYGEKVLFDNLVKQKDELETWAKDVCKEFNCSYEIFVTANYW